jgi:hypothetical protein
MSSVFPFNQAAKLPNLVISRIKPVVDKQLEKFNQVFDQIQQRLASLGKNVKCNDPKVLDLKRKLAKLKIIINELNRINQRLQPLAANLQAAARIANITSTILLAIPAVPGVPEGPKNQTLQTIADLIAGITAVINILNVLLKIINKITNKANSLIAKTERKLNSICGTGNDNSILNINNNNNNVSTNNTDTPDSNLSPEAALINATYPSEFYDSVNVSDVDLDQRVTEINTLIQDQLDVVQNLIEAPSKVLRGNGAPNNNLGNIGDYYIDIATQTIYGPKASQNSWT